MFSATMPPAVERIARNYLRAPAYVYVGDLASHKNNIAQHIYVMKENKKKDKLVELLQNGIYIYVYIYTYIRTYVCVHINVYAYILLRVYVFVYINTYVYACSYIVIYKDVYILYIYIFKYVKKKNICLFM